MKRTIHRTNVYQLIGIERIEITDLIDGKAEAVHYLGRIQNLAINEDPQHIYRALALDPVVPKRIQPDPHPLWIWRIELERAVTWDIQSRMCVAISVLFHTEPTHARFGGA